MGGYLKSYASEKSTAKAKSAREDAKNANCREEKQSKSKVMKGGWGLEGCRAKVHEEKVVRSLATEWGIPF